MNKQIFKATIFTTVLALGIGAVTYAKSNNQDITSEKSRGNNSVTVLAQNNLVGNGAIQYTVSKNDKSQEIEVDVLPQDQTITPQTLIEYKNKMPAYFKQIKAKQYETTPLTVTMSKPVSLDQFKKFTDDYNIDVDRFYIQTYDQSGEPGIISGVPGKEELIPIDKLNGFLNVKGNPLREAGVVAVKGTIPVQTENFNNLINSEHVFLADVTHQIIKDDVTNSSY